MVSNYNIKKIKSCGIQYFEFDIDYLKKFLQTKFKYDFQDTNDIIPKDPNPLDGEPDYKKLFYEQQEEIYKLKQEINKMKNQKPKKEIKIQIQTDDELEKELESLISK